MEFETEKYEFLVKLIEFAQSEGLMLYKSIRRSRLILYTYNYNFIGLKEKHRYFNLHVNSGEFWDNQAPQLRWNMQKGLSTRLFNYLNSISAVVDLSRINSNKYLSSTQNDKYKEHIKLNYEDVPKFKFIRELRNYIAHYSLLDIGVELSMNYQAGNEGNIYLSKSKLLEWDGWKKQAFLYLTEQNEKIYIIPYLLEYHKQFLTTQNILYCSMISRNELALVELVDQMEVFYGKASKFRLLNSLPYRKTTIRYIQYLLRTCHKLSI